MRVPENACALCDSEWGDYWAEVDGQRMFFCCWVCHVMFDRMVQEVKRRTGWGEVDAIDIVGDYRGRHCTASHGSEVFPFRIRFDTATGEILEFLPEGESAGPAASL